MRYPREVEPQQLEAFRLLKSEGLDIQEAYLWFTIAQLPDHSVKIALGALTRAVTAALQVPPDLAAAQVELDCMASFCMEDPVEESFGDYAPTLN